jgi:hypothetical protein
LIGGRTNEKEEGRWQSTESVLTFYNRPRRCRGGEYTIMTRVEREMILLAFRFGETEEEGARVKDGVGSCRIV